MAIMARNMLVAAFAAGYTVEVGSEGEIDYRGTEIVSAWEACKAVEEADVYLIKEGSKREVAFVIAAGVDDDETLADFTTGGWIEKWYDTVSIMRAQANGY